VKSALLYFGMVFGAGFVFGVIRTLWVVMLIVFALIPLVVAGKGEWVWRGRI